MTITMNRNLRIGTGEYDRDYCYLHVYNRDDLSDATAKCTMDFSAGHRLSGVEQKKLCNSLRAAVEMADAIAAAPESSEPLTDAEILPWARGLIRTARELGIL